MDKILINLFDRHNQGNLIAIDEIKPNKVIYIIDEEIQDIFENIGGYEQKIYSKIEFKNYIINEKTILNIRKLLERLPVKNTIINITSGKRIYSLILFNEALNLGFKTISIDMLNKNIYEFGSNFKRKKFELMDLNLENMFKLTGADILKDSTKLIENQDVINIVKKIYENIDIWYELKNKLYDKNIFIHDYYDNNKISIKSDNLDFRQKKILNICLKYLKDLKVLDYTKICEEIEVKFLKENIKSLIFKSGTWLEVLTNIVVKEMTEIDEVKSGVIFLWEECNNTVRNELDVLAVKDSIFICISCKDSDKYDEDALNELEVYSKRLGGNVVKKILVATKNPCKKCVVERAKAMDINLIILENDIDKFRNSLKNIILNKNNN